METATTKDSKDRVQDMIDERMEALVTQTKTAMQLNNVVLVGANLISQRMASLINIIVDKFPQAFGMIDTVNIIIDDNSSKYIGTYCRECKTILLNIGALWEKVKMDAMEKDMNILSLMWMNLQLALYHECGHAEYAANHMETGTDEDEEHASNVSINMMPSVYMSNQYQLGEPSSIEDEPFWNLLWLEAGMEMRSGNPEFKWIKEQIRLLEKGIITDGIDTIKELLMCMSKYEKLAGWAEAPGNVERITPTEIAPEKEVVPVGNPEAGGSATGVMPNVEGMLDDDDYGLDYEAMIAGAAQGYEVPTSGGAIQPAVAPVTPAAPVATAPAPNPEFVQWGVNMLTFAANEIIRLCGWDGRGNLQAPNNILSPTSIAGLMNNTGGGKLIAYETMNQAGQVITKELGADMMIAGRTFNNNLVGYILTFQQPDGMNFKRTIILQNPNKTGQDGNLTKSAQKAQAGNVICWVMDSNKRTGGLLGKIENGTYSKWS